MKIIGIETDKSSDNKWLNFTIIASTTVPSGAYASVTISYIKYDKKKDIEYVVNKKTPLQNQIISGDELIGRVSIKGVHEELLEDYQITASFDSVSIDMEDETISEVKLDKEDFELKEFTKRPILTGVEKFWSNDIDSDFSPKTIAWSNAVPDRNSALRVKITADFKYGFPGLYSPIITTQLNFNELIGGSTNDLKDRNGQVYIVKGDTNRIAILFANIHRSYVEYYSIEEVYSFEVIPDNYALDVGFYTVDSSGVKRRDSVDFSTPSERIIIPSENFEEEIITKIEPYYSDVLLLSNRWFERLEDRDLGIEIDELGSSREWMYE